MAITRTAIIDDDGSGTTGTSLDNAWKQELYDQIDAADVTLPIAESDVTNLVADLAALVASIALKRPLVPRVGGTTSSATPTPDADAQDAYELTAQAAAAAFANPTGTPVNFQKLVIRIKDNGTARALTWGTAYVAGGVALPTTTVISKILTIGFMYNTANALNKWMCVAATQEA
jgi:hypothetical protein